MVTTAEPPRTEDVGVVELLLDAPFDSATSGNPEAFCDAIEADIAAAAGVSVDRVDAKNCQKGDYHYYIHFQLVIITKNCF